MNNFFEIQYTGHEREARELLINNKIKTVEEVAYMTSKEIENAITDNFICYKCDVDWLLIPKDKEKEFNKMVTWICR